MANSERNLESRITTTAEATTYQPTNPESSQIPANKLAILERL